MRSPRGRDEQRKARRIFYVQGQNAAAIGDGRVDGNPYDPNDPSWRTAHMWWDKGWTDWTNAHKEKQQT